MTMAASRLCTLNQTATHQVTAAHTTSEVAGTVAVVAALVVVVLLFALTRAARIYMDLMTNALKVTGSITSALVTMVIVAMIAVALLVYH